MLSACSWWWGEWRMWIEVENCCFFLFVSPGFISRFFIYKYNPSVTWALTLVTVALEIFYVYLLHTFQAYLLHILTITKKNHRHIQSFLNLQLEMDNRTSSSLLSPPVQDAYTAHARLQLLTLLQDLHEANHPDAQEAGAALEEILQLISDEPIPAFVPTNAAPPIEYSHKTVNRLMYSLHRTNVSSLAEDDKLCEICFLCFDEWRWDDEERQISNKAGEESEPFQVLVDMMPENPVKLSCGHIFGELCLRTWLLQIIPKGGPPTCPKCRAKLSESDSAAWKNFCNTSSRREYCSKLLEVNGFFIFFIFRLVQLSESWNGG